MLCIKMVVVDSGGEPLSFTGVISFKVLRCGALSVSTMKNQYCFAPGAWVGYKATQPDEEGNVQDK